MPPKARPAIERAQEKIQRGGSGDCWPWIGATNSRARGARYGHLSAGPGQGYVYVHRLVYEHEKGPIPDGYEVDHTCRFSLCCNPAHLEAVPPYLNNARSTSPTSLNIRKDQCPQGHEYDAENTGYRRARGWRYCRACARESQRARRAEGMSYPEWLASR